MRSAARLYRFQLLLGGLGVSAAAAALAVSVGNIELTAASPAALASACRQWLPILSLAEWVTLALLVIVFGCVVRGIRTAVSHLRTSRAYITSLPIGPMTVIDGVGTRVVAISTPLAFCAGFLRPRIYVSEGALEELDRAELRAVLAHEEHHRRRRDPLRILAANAMASSLFFLPSLREASRRYALLGELAADEAAIRRLHGPAPLASALVKFSDAPTSTAAAIGVAGERVDHLAGEPGVTEWRLSGSNLAASLGLLVGLAVLPLAVTAGGTSIRLPLVAAQSCMLAMTLLAVGLVATTLGMIGRRLESST